MKIYLDLEKTLIDTELNPVIIPNNKKLIDKLKEKYNVTNFHIFSSVLQNDLDITKFMLSDTRTNIEKYFGIKIESCVEMDRVWDMMQATAMPWFEEVKGFEIMSRPCKESTFLLYAASLNDDDAYLLLDDTIRTGIYTLHNKTVNFIRGL